MKHGLVFLLVGAAACSSGGAERNRSPQGVVRAVPATTALATSFAAIDSGPVVKAAMTYPQLIATDEPAPPLSLTASDGTGLALVSLDAQTVIDGPLAFTELRLRFANPRDRVIEGRFAITLPPGAAISRLAMNIEGTGWQEAEVVERTLARRAYEDFLHRRQDPALLEKEAGNEFRARIFPIPANGNKDLVVSYSQELVGDDATYALPLRGLPEIEKLHVTALVKKPGAAAYEAVTLDQQRWKPDRDFEAAAVTAAGVRAAGVAVARVSPAVPATPVAVDSLAIVFDTSASRALGFAGEVQRLGALVAGLRAAHGDDVHLMVAAFDQDVAPIFDGAIRAFGEADLDALRARRPLGASDLAAALRWAAGQDAARVLVVTDAIATAGSDEGDALHAAVAAMKGHVDRLDVLLVGGIRDDEIAARLVRGTLASDGVILGGDLGDDEIVRRIGQETRSGITVGVAGATWVWPATIDGVQPGDDVLVYAGLAKGSAMKVTLGGGLTQTVEVPLTAGPEPLVTRAAARAEIARLGFERDGLAPDDRAGRDRLRDRIIEMSTRHRVLSDYTALLVLETEDDYARFGIDRKSLADIMTVGAKGVEVVHRRLPVIVTMVEPGADELRKQELEKNDKTKEKKSEAADRDDDDDADGELDLKASPDKLVLLSEESDDGPAVPTVTIGAASQAEALGREAPDAEPGDVDSGAHELEVSARGYTSSGSADGVGYGSASGAAGAIAPAPDSPRPAERRVDEAPPVAERLSGPAPLEGKLADIMAMLGAGERDDALVAALAWRADDAGDVLALVALGEALEARGNLALAARAYGSIIDLFPARADLRRFAGERLDRLGEVAQALAIDTFRKAVAQRPDHLTGHRLLAFALARAGRHAEALDALEHGLAQEYPDDRFRGGTRILTDDLGLIAAALIKAKPAQRGAIERRLAARGATLATTPSLRFVLYWETDANDVDFHIYDGKGGHAYYSQKELPSGGGLYEDVTTGYGPECFTIDGAPAAYPYDLQIHYYSRGPMGYGMGKLEVIAHDGNGTLSYEQRPFTVMVDSAYVDLGKVTTSIAGVAPGDAAAQPSTAIAH